MNSASMPRVSVLTPCYNNAEYLAECIESVLAQTYRNWDYTIVDNCSTDGSAEIAHRYAQKDSRLRVRENPTFLRAVANHNVAFRQTSRESKYCKMVFADDWIFPDCLERMVAVAEEHPSVGIVGAYGLRGTQAVWTGLAYPSTVVSGREICRQRFLNGLYVFGTATSLLFCADLVRGRDPFYNEANLHSDAETCHALLKTCDFGFVHQVLTFTRIRPDSISTFTTDYHTLPAGALQELIAHGQDYLTRAEFDACLNRDLSEYYRFLGKSVLLGRNKGFWEYHKRKLNEAGVGFDRARVAGAAFLTLVSAGLNLKDTFEKLLKRARSHLLSPNDTSPLVRRDTCNSRVAGASGSRGAIDAQAQLKSE